MAQGKSDVDNELLEKIQAIVGTDRQIISVMAVDKAAVDHTFCFRYGPAMICLPLLFPILPCYCCDAAALQQTLRHTNYVLTNREVVVLLRTHPTQCGCLCWWFECGCGFNSGDDSVTIPLENIVTVKVDEGGDGTLCGYQAKFSSLSIETASMTFSFPREIDTVSRVWTVEDPHAVRRMIEEARDNLKANENSAPVYASAPVTESKRVFVASFSAPENFAVVVFSSEEELWTALETEFGTMERILKLAEIGAEVSPIQIQNGDKLILG